MYALMMGMQIGGMGIAIASLLPLLKVAAIVRTPKLRWAWRCLTLMILLCVLAAIVGVVEKVGTSANTSDVAGSVPRLLGPCFVFVVAWLSFKTAQDSLGFSLLHDIAFKDFLTGIANRRALDKRLSDDIQQANSQKSPLSVLLLDIDHFKKINDHHGHDVGDAVLKNVGTLLGANIRSEDLAGRFGGEEFLIIMPCASQEIAAAAANRLRIMLSDFRTLPPNVSAVGITVSFGVATLRAGETSTSLLRRADLALYASKRQGRDQVVVSP
jgi:diguanylate cyclase (GGDEF)-like protein